MERGALICRSLLEEDRHTDPLSDLEWGDARHVKESTLNARGAMLASQQGIRVHAAFRHIRIPEEGEVHIVDWNAAQGFHTMALLEVLIARKQIGRVSHVTLVHPSEAALERARCGVGLLTGRCSIDTFCRNLPAREGQQPFGITFTAPVVIHLLPDCMNLPDIDLPLLAYLISRPGYQHIVMCVNALTPDADNAPALMKLTPGAECLLDSAESTVGYTLAHYPVSSRAVAWKCSPEQRPPCPQSEIYTVGERPAAGIEYEWRHRLKMAGLPEACSELCYDLARVLTKKDYILLRPALAPYEADMAIVRPERGVTLARFIVSGLDTEVSVKTAVNELRHMRRFLAMHLPCIDGRSRVRRTIKIAVIALSPTSSLPVLPLEGDALLAGVDMLHSEHGSELLCRFLPGDGNELFVRDIFHNVLELLAPPWHWAVTGTELTFDSGQQVAGEPDGPFVVEGAAGSGKTTVLLHRAVRTQMLHAGPALIVVPGASASGSMREGLRKLFMDFSPAQIHVVSLPDLKRREWESRTTTHEGHEGIGNYSTILVDDAHLMFGADLMMLRRVFLAEGGEMIISSNPLERGMIMETERRRVTLTGMYIAADESTSLTIKRVMHKLNPSLPEIKSLPDMMKGSNYIRLDSGSTAAIAEVVANVMRDSNFQPQDTLIIGQSELILRELTTILTDKYGYSCMATFPMNSEIEACTAGVRNVRGAIGLMEATVPHRFLSGSQKLRIAHVSQATGIHARNVICLYRRSLRPDYSALYCSLTRAINRAVLLSYM